MGVVRGSFAHLSPLSPDRWQPLPPSGIVPASSPHPPGVFSEPSTEILPVLLASAGALSPGCSPKSETNTLHPVFRATYSGDRWMGESWRRSSWSMVPASN